MRSAAVSDWRRRVTLSVVSVEATAGLATEITRIDVLLEQRAWPVLVVTEHPMHHLHDREAGIEADQVGELEGSHRLIRAELHCGIDIGDAANALIERVNAFVDHRQQD